ncbi:hypothetical protein NEF87_002172 [Candidatus Lokiarchaeum ossiferum]|uniref:DUF86 domain-containing protein n=1 Tax=Candidatus Lokiarchaeum ossiferum TaxID=2951803 RepID=A0ABY6HQW2_9ARCH|nr:hypothetical protein NEF87_002172 [Candidatus Lokiarchaeum sp. B-35]
MPKNSIPNDINYFNHIISKYEDLLNGELKDVFLRYAIKEAFLITELFQSLGKDEITTNDICNNIAILINSLYDIETFHHNTYTELNDDQRLVLHEQMNSLITLEEEK